MLARIRDNWTYKILAITCAIVLRCYIIAQQNPRLPRIVTNTLAVHSLPGGLVVVDKPTTVTVTLSGSSEDLNRLNDASVSASVDLRNARAGLNTGLPVDVSINPPSIRSGITISDYKPKTVSLQIDQKRKRWLPVSVILQGTPSPGYITHRPALITKSAMISGPASLIDTVARLVIKPDISGSTNSIDDEFQIIPLDAAGRDAANIQISPDTARVQITVLQEGRSKDVFISPDIKGTPASGYTIGEVSILPSFVTVSGPPGQLAALGRILTEPIDISNAKSDIVRHVRCIVPKGAKIDVQDPVTVTVKIAPLNTGSPALPAHPAQPGGNTLQRL